jgi:Protein of unknown function (DUF2442)
MPQRSHPWRDPDVFEQIKVDEQTGTITWPVDVDLDPDVIYAALDPGPDKARIYVLTPSSPRDASAERYEPRQRSRRGVPLRDVECGRAEDGFAQRTDLSTPLP